MREPILRVRGKWLLSRRAVLRGAGAALVVGCGGGDKSPVSGVIPPVDAGKDTKPSTPKDAGANGSVDMAPGEEEPPAPPQPGGPDAGAQPDSSAPPPETPADAAPPAPGENHPPEFPVPAWVRTARIGGLDGNLEGAQLNAALDAMASQGVSVVELDSSLSFYKSDAEFEAEAVRLDGVAKAIHQRGMKTVIYYPTLEVLTLDAANAPGSMGRDHADWVQKDIKGKPNVFIGGEGSVFWVEPGVESAWLCPNSPYGEYFVERVARLARTALDGLWGDVPLLADLAGVYPCTCTFCRTKFSADTGGLTLPTAVNFEDATFRRWMVWRHDMMWKFEQRIVERARQVRADFQVVIETVTMDYSGATVQGLDGASHDDGQVMRVWEVDAVSDKTAMRNASAEDWLDMTVMMKHGAGCSAPRPSWVFCYGDQPDDAEQVFGLAIATGNNPYELKVPVMSSTVNAAYRQRVFKWLEGEEALYAGYPLHDVAVLYSSASRDFLDQGAGIGLYSSLFAADPAWWSTEPDDLAPTLPYLGDYRGWCRALVHAHMPYDVVPVSRLTPQALSRYKLVIVPSAVSLSDATIGQLATYAGGGGALLASGPNLGRFDENGRDRGSAALLAGLGLAAGARKGAVAHVADPAGVAYMHGNGQRATMELTMAVKDPQIVTNAPAGVVLGVRRTRTGKLVLAASNLQGLGAARGTFTSQEASFQVSLALGGKRATAVVGSQPSGGRAPLAFEMKDGRVQFTMKTRAIALATIDLGQ